MPDTDHEFTPEDVGLNAERLSVIPEFFDTSYVQTGKLPCMATLVSRNGQIVHEAYRGTTELGGNEPISENTIFRIYSMTKPITAVAAMILCEEAAIRLDHPISKYIPEFADVQVWAGGDEGNFETKKPDRAMTVRDAMTHVTGVTYGFLGQHPVDALYRQEEIGRPDETLEDMCKRIAQLPLLFSPGTAWNYGHSTDILGRVIEVASGQTFDTFLRDRILNPLGMVDTDFYVPEDKLERLMACYHRDPLTKQTILVDGAGAGTLAYRKQPMNLNPGGGLVSTLRDYHRFCLMLLHGGTLDGARILSPKSVEFMRMNHLPNGQTIKTMGDKTFSEARMDGNGFGIGGSVIVDVAETMMPGSVGTYSWGGLANTFFWIDFAEELIAVQASQLMPSNGYPIRPQFQQLVYASLDW